MSAAERECGDGVRDDAAPARVTPLNRAVSARKRVYPLLMIDGVYRASFAMGLAVYALPSLPASTRISRHRARVSVRRASHALRALDETNADANRADVSRADSWQAAVSPRAQEPIHPVFIRQAGQHLRKQP